MRYVLLVVGVIASLMGLTLLFDDRPQGGLWLQIGAGFVAVGAATCDLVAAIRAGANPRRSEEQLEQFRQALHAQDAEKMARLLAKNGVPEDLARSTAQGVIVQPDRVRI